MCNEKTVSRYEKIQTISLNQSAIILCLLVLNFLNMDSQRGVYILKNKQHNSNKMILQQKK